MYTLEYALLTYINGQFERLNPPPIVCVSQWVAAVHFLAEYTLPAQSFCLWYEISEESGSDEESLMYFMSCFVRVTSTFSNG